VDVPIASAITLGIAIASAGVVIGKLIAVGEKVRQLERSRDRQGERLGELEKTLAVERERRRATTGINPVVPPRGGGQVKKAVDDDEEGSNDHG
jgi:hypothetical protein